jgi:hypothetical protein
LASASAERYGRDALEVELDRQAALARVDGERRQDLETTYVESTTVSGWPVITPGSGVLAPDRTVIGGEVPNPPPPRPPKKKSSPAGGSRMRKTDRAGPRPPDVAVPDTFAGTPEDSAGKAR